MIALNDTSTIYNSNLPNNCDAALKYLIKRNAARKWSPYGNEVPVLYRNIVMWHPDRPTPQPQPVRRP
jgi:hypothetical protein